MSEQTIPFVLERGGRECDCGPTVIQCAHFNEHCVALYRMVYGGEAGDCWHLCLELPYNCGEWFEDGDSALAAFDAAVIALLRGDA